MILRHLSLSVLGALLLSGCMSRQLLVATDAMTGGGETTTLLQTLDTRSYVLFSDTRHVFWECGEEGQQGLVCRKACDIDDSQGDRLQCPRLSPLFGN